MRKLLTLIGLGLATSVWGIDTSILVTNSDGVALGQYSNIISGGARVALISLVNPNAVASGTFYLLDAPAGVTNLNGTVAINRFTNYVTNASGQIGYSNGPYNSVVQYTTNIKVFYTNFMGISNFQVMGGTYTNNPVYQSNVLFTTTNTASAATNAYRILFSGTVGSSAILTITNQFNVIYGLGILQPNLSSNTVNVTWSSSL